MRKRIFWSVFSLHVTIAGVLGRPLQLRTKDWDIEMPEAVDDELLSESGIDRTRPGKCSFLVGMVYLPAVEIMTDMYNSIYTAQRSPRTYADTVRSLEKRIDDWVARWPAKFRESMADENDPGHMHAHYLGTAPCHMRLLLRHPSLSLTNDANMIAENLSSCLDTSRVLLRHIKQIQKFKSLDGTWYSTSLYILAISTTLFAHWERRDSITTASLGELRSEMTSWLSIINDLGQLLGE